MLELVLKIFYQEYFRLLAAVILTECKPALV